MPQELIKFPANNHYNLNMKRTILLLLAICYTVQFSIAQDKKIIKYAKTITPDDARKHLTILASDEYEGRETGAPGAEKAAQYIKKQFQSLNLKGLVNEDYFQKLGINETSLGKTEIIANGKTFEFVKDYYFNPGSVNINNKTYKDFVFVGYGIADKNYDDLTAADLTGKVVIVLKGEPVKDGNSIISGTKQPSDWSTSRSKKNNALFAKNPALILSVDPQIERMAAYKEYFTQKGIELDGKTNTKAPILNISEGLANELMSAGGKTIAELKNSINESAKFNPLSFSSSLTANILTSKTPIEAKNVLGFMEGSDQVLKNEVVVITAHYDHVGVDEKGDAFNGADDDGSGTTGVLEIAEAFSMAKADKKGPKRSILFMTVVGEEKGLLGSEWYSSHPIFPLENTIVNLNIDMIGRVGFEYKKKPDSLNYVYVIGSDKLSSELKTISETANNTYAKMTLDYKYDDPNDQNRFYYRSDHYNFAKNNIPIIFYFNGVHEDYHKQTDEVKKINFEALTKRAQLVFYTAWELANRATKPKVDSVNNMPESR